MNRAKRGTIVICLVGVLLLAISFSYMFYFDLFGKDFSDISSIHIYLAWGWLAILFSYIYLTVKFMRGIQTRKKKKSDKLENKGREME